MMKEMYPDEKNKLVCLIFGHPNFAHKLNKIKTLALISLQEITKMKYDNELRSAIQSIIILIFNPICDIIIICNMNKNLKNCFIVTDII